MVSAAAEPWLEFGACAGALILLLFVAGAILAPRQNPWIGMLWMGASALLLAITSYILLLRLDELRRSVLLCPECGWSLAPYALGGWLTGLIALALACASCAFGLQAAWRRRQWILTTTLLAGLLAPPLAVVSLANGFAQSLIPSERYLSPLIAAQSLLVLACSVYLRATDRPASVTG